VTDGNAGSMDFHRLEASPFFLAAFWIWNFGMIERMIILSVARTIHLQHK
jgi:hypothetical protein